MNNQRKYLIDVSALESDCVSCPKCSNKIDPDDLSERKYSIIDKILLHGQLRGVILACNRCQSILELVGFEHIEVLEDRLLLNVPLP